MQKPKTTECVKVAIRCRPISSKEEQDQRKVIVHIVQERGEVTIQNPANNQDDKNFTFDIAIPPGSSQESVYSQTALPIVESVLEGYNGTIFAYGQTGTGKTFTMEGNIEVADKKGIIPRAFEHIFNSIEGTPNKQFLVRASYLELYNEEIRDLLSKNYKTKLELREQPDVGIYVKDLSAYNIQGVAEMSEKLQMGHKNRKVGMTDMNQDSSRSHSIFMITVEMIETYADNSQHIRAGKLNLVDLAGSERQSKTHATGERFKEAININQSLATLGNVISALVDGKSSHIPYRDSKLTRLLQDSLGGNTKTVMIANIGPVDYNFDETLSTLRYANRAKSIKNKPKINEDPKDAKIRQYQEEIQKLKEQLATKGSSKLDGKSVVRQKVVHVDDEETERELELRLQREREELTKQYQEERKQIEERKNLQKNEKERLLRELEEKQKMEREAKSEQERLLNKLKDMEEKLLKGDQLKEESRRKQKELLKAKIELEERQQGERRMQEEVEKMREIQLNAQEKYKSMEDEVQQKTKKLQNLINRIKQEKSKTQEIHEISTREKNYLLDENRQISRELSLTLAIINHFIPPDEVTKIRQRLIFSEEEDNWVIDQNSEANNAPAPPGSAIGLKRPMCEQSKMSINFGEVEVRIKHENILNLELDLPEPTTEIFQGQYSQKLQETIQTALNQDEEDLNNIANEKIPNVYIEDPNEISKENAINSTINSNRAKSATKKVAKRPQSGNRKY